MKTKWSFKTWWATNGMAYNAIRRFRYGHEAAYRRKALDARREYYVKRVRARKLAAVGERLMLTVIDIPVRTVSEPNMREHWATRHKRAKAQRAQAYWYARSAAPSWSQKACLIRLTRVAPRELDSDNLACALKAIRDGITDGLGRKNDRDDLLWEYAQKKGKANSVLVHIMEVKGQ